MNEPHLRFHHFGLAVKRPESARKFVAALGYQRGEAIFDPAQNVFLELCVHDSHPAVEIIWPGSDAGPVDKLAQRHTSGIVYHLCYETDNLSAALAGLDAQGLNPVCVSRPTVSPLFNGRNVSFYNVIGVGLIEILEP